MNVLKGEAPSVRDTCSRRVSTDSNPARADLIYRGAATKIWASTTANVVNPIWMPTMSKLRPIKPTRPNASSSDNPATTGGSTIGRSIRVSIMGAIGMDRRANK